MKKLSTTQKVLIAGGALTAGIWAYKKFAGSAAAQQENAALPAFLPQDSNLNDPLADEYYNIIRDALNSGGQFIYFDESYDIERFKASNTWWNKSHPDQPRTAYQHARAMAGWSVKKGKEIKAVTGVSGLGDVHQRSFSTQNLLS